MCLQLAHGMQTRVNRITAAPNDQDSPTHSPAPKESGVTTIANKAPPAHRRLGEHAAYHCQVASNKISED
jgi:hypothetical protein